MGEEFTASRSLSAPSRLIPCVLVCMCGWLNSLEAAQFDYSLGYRAEYSDNVTRIPNERDGQSDLINTASAGFSYIENTSTINTRVVGGAAYSTYRRSSFENQTNYNLDAYGEAFVVQRTLSWVAADGFRKLQIDPLLPDTPANRQNSNSWATGPNVYLRLGSVDTVSFEGRYGRAWVENLDIDNNRYSYAARWAHRATARSVLSLNYEHLDVDFENDALNTDLSRQNYFLRADFRDARTQLTFDLGHARIERSGYQPDGDWLIHLTASMQAATASSMGLGYRREYSDTGGDLLPTAAPTQPSVDANMPTLGADVVTSEPYYLEAAELYYTYRGNVFPWTVQMFHRDIDYQTLPLDRQEKGVLVDVRYLYSSSVSFHLLSTYNILAYDQPLREDRESNVGITLTYRMTPNLRAELDLRRFGRRSTAPGQEYTDDRVALTLLYGNRPVAAH